jgi:ERCC4-type nuclease
MSKFKLLCEENIFVYEKIENLRKKSLRIKDDQKAGNAKRILIAIEKFPLPILKGKIAADLIQGVGPWWSKKIDKWLSEKPTKRKASPIISNKRVLYIPTFNTPEWISLMCLYKSPIPIASYDIPHIISKSLSEYSITPPADSKKALDFLCTVNLATEDIGLYTITPLGLQTAYKIQSECPTVLKTNLSEFDADAWLTEEYKEDARYAGTNAFEFSIVLIVDSSERLSMDFNVILERLCNRNLQVERKKLWIGDYQWVCRTKVNGKVTDYALEYVVERKTADDLAKSIIDSRYEDQKIRMKMSQSKCIYLLEGKSVTTSRKITLNTLMNSILSTKFNYGFQIKLTQDSKDTLNWLARFTNSIFQEVSNWTKEKIKSLITFEEFYDFTNPNADITVKEIFGKQLRALENVGEQNTLAVINKLPAPFLFYKEISKAQAQGKRALGKFLKSIRLENGNVLGKSTREALFYLFLG